MTDFSSRFEDGEPKIASSAASPPPDGLESYLADLAELPDQLDERRATIYRRVLLTLSFVPPVFDEQELSALCGAVGELPSTIEDMVNAAGGDDAHWPRASARYRRVWVPELETETIVCQLRWEDPTALVLACRDDWPQTRTALSAALTIGAGLHGVPGFTWRLFADEPDWTGVTNVLDSRLELAQDGDLDSIRWLLHVYRRLTFDAAPRHIEYWLKRGVAAGAPETGTEFS